jgi:hypothetical protein
VLLREAKRRGNLVDPGSNGWGLPRRFAPRMTIRGNYKSRSESA